MESLKDKVTIITGSGSGFGKATALLFAGYRAKLALADINFEAAQEVAKLCQESGLPETHVIAVHADITDEEARKTLIDQTISKFGRLDVLVNNAGVGRFKTLMTTTEEIYDVVMNVNVKAQIFLTKLAVPYLKESKGCIVNLASIGSQEPIYKGTVYCMSKAAIDMFTKCTALELAVDGIRVNSVRPGYVQTALYDKDFGAHTPLFMENVLPQHPLGRLGTPEEVAKAIAFLASDMASFTTGDYVAVDGGHLCAGMGYNAHSVSKPKEDAN